MTKKYDFVFVGGGPAGYTGALHAAQSGKKVAVVERENLGGTCLNVGCIPSKAWLATAGVARTLKNAKRHGFSTGAVEFDYNRARKRVEQVVDTLRKGIGENLFPKYGVELFEGDGRVEDGLVLVETAAGKVKLEANSIVLATGSSELVPDWFGGPGPRRITSKEALYLDELPQKVLIIGGGAIGCEFASFWTDLGVQVTLVELQDQLLPGVDSQIAEVLEKGLKRRKVKIHTATGVQNLGGSGNKQSADLVAGEVVSAWEGDTILLCIGRVPNTKGLGLVDAGVKLDDKGRVVVDAYSRQTSVPGLYACGDLTDGPMLAHKAIYEVLHLLDIQLGRKRESLDWNRVPMCVYTEPEVAWVGSAEGKVGEAVPMAASGRARAEASIEGFMKAWVDEDSGLVNGLFAVGDHVSEMIAPAALSIGAGLTWQQWLHSVAPHPTRSEMFFEAVLAAGQGHSHSI